MQRRFVLKQRIDVGQIDPEISPAGEAEDGKQAPGPEFENAALRDRPVVRDVTQTHQPACLGGGSLGARGQVDVGPPGWVGRRLSLFRYFLSHGPMLSTALKADVRP